MKWGAVSGGLFHTPDLDERGLIFFEDGGVKKVNLKLRLVYRVKGYAATGKRMHSLYLYAE